MMKIAFQGAAGAFSEEAAVALCGARIEVVPCETFDDVIDAVLSSKADAGVLPVENSSIGVIHSAVEALDGSDLKVQRDLDMPIHHCLLGLRNARIQDIRKVISHPAALGQCQRYLGDASGMTASPWFDTAGAARHVAQTGDPTMAAIASARAALRWGLQVIASNIEDLPDNSTRFVLVGR